MNKYDVLVVGAGPSGSMLSYYLGTAGANVLLTDKQILPRYKACGGGITHRASTLIPFDIDSIVEDYSYGAFISWKGEPLYSGISSYPIIAMVMREKFDYFLACKAMSSGVEVMDNTSVISIDHRKTSSVVTTSRGIYNAGIVVGADGANSRVAKALGLHIESKYKMAFVAEVYPQNIDQLDIYKKEVHFDLNFIPGGYGWIFPKKDHLSVGLFAPINMARYMQIYLDKFLRAKKIKNLYKVKKTEAHLIPTHPNENNVLGNSNGCVVGDATCFVDPVTGEGIFYALREAQIGSSIIIQYGPSGLLEYSDMLKSEFMKEMRAAETMAMILYKFPRTSKYILKWLPEHAHDHIKIICGEQSYVDLYREVFSVKSVKKILSQFIGQ